MPLTGLSPSISGSHARPQLESPSDWLVVAGSTAPPAFQIPTEFKKALEYDVPYPLMITERAPPYKTVHVNNAWCLNFGFRGDELIGRPFSLLFGPRTDSNVKQLLDDSFACCRQVSDTQSAFLSPPT